MSPESPAQHGPHGLGRWWLPRETGGCLFAVGGGRAGQAVGGGRRRLSRAGSIWPIHKLSDGFSFSLFHHNLVKPSSLCGPSEASQPWHPCSPKPVSSAQLKYLCAVFCFFFSSSGLYCVHSMQAWKLVPTRLFFFFILSTFSYHPGAQSIDFPASRIICICLGLAERSQNMFLVPSV